MKKYCLLFIQFIFSMPLFANSAWVFFTDEPYTILPIVIIFTLLFEIILIIYFNEIKIISKIIFGSIMIIIANILSFLFSLFYIYFSYGKEILTNISKGIENNFIGKIIDILFYFPFYNYYGIELLIFTLFIEVPFVYFTLKYHIKNRFKLLISIIIVNIISTVILMIFEKIKIKGTL